MARIYGPGPAEPPPLVSTTDLEGLSTNDVEDRPVGELFGALSEEGTGLIRYLDVSLRGASKHVLVPIGHARIEWDATPPRVRLRAATYEDLLSVPDFDPEETSMSRSYQEDVMQVHGRLFYGSRYYAHPSFDHRVIKVGEAEVAGPEEREEKGPVLQPLSEMSGYRVARSARDIRGWSIEDRDGDVAGEVVDLLVEVAARKARYAVIRLGEPARLAALPVGYLEMAEERERVVTPSLESEDVRLLPPYAPPLDRGQENRIHATLEGRLTGERYFQRPDFHPR